jgi:hypothetical protein
MKISLKSAILLGALCCVFANSVRADLLGVNPGFPKASYVSQDPMAVNYDPTTQLFNVTADPTGIQFSALESGIIIQTNRSVQIQIQVDTNGNLVSGISGYTLTGQFTRVVGGVTNTYSGTLLQGNVIAFGSLESGFSDQYDFRVHLTGGQLLSFFNCGDDLAINLTSESSTFTGSFGVAFNGAAKGACGMEDLTPPVVTCPPASQIKTTPATDPNNPSINGFIVTYPDPIVTDNCDPQPTTFCDTPSGTFLPLNPGDSITITCYGIDESGNFNFCSFVVVMQPPPPVPCLPVFVGGACQPATLPNDPGQCSATYTFSLPLATNCSGQFVVVTANAMNEAGGVISLTNLGNGMVLGHFPRTTTTNGDIITFTADDGLGNHAVRQCQVFVQDKEPPTLMCLNQMATFKPVFTNALSCITADFGCPQISSNSTIWFSSVLNTPSASKAPFTVRVFDQQIQLSIGPSNLVIDVPDAFITISNGVAVATTIFTNGQWVTIARPSSSGNTFLSGVAYDVPFNLAGCNSGVCSYFQCRDGRNRGQNPHVSATWCGRFAVSSPGAVVNWGWTAAVYTKFGTDYNQLGVKTVDGSTGCSTHNTDDAGTPEAFKQFVIAGARGDGRFSRCGDDGDKYTGELTDFRKANLGMGMMCEGVVDFHSPMAADNCDGSVVVTCTPPSGSLFGPGDHLITCTAVDHSGNSNQCSFTLTVLSPLQVVFDSPGCDNIVDNTSQPDAGFTDMNCPDDPSTPQFVNCFHSGDKICHTVRLLDCNGSDVTCTMASCVTVHIDVTERQGSYSSSSLVKDVTENFSYVGSRGGIMVPCGGQFQYNLDTTGFEGGTLNGSRFFRSCVWVEYNSSPGVPVGMEDVILESR